MAWIQCLAAGAEQPGIFTGPSGYIPYKQAFSTKGTPMALQTTDASPQTRSMRLSLCSGCDCLISQNQSDCAWRNVAEAWVRCHVALLLRLLLLRCRYHAKFCCRDCWWILCLLYASSYPLCSIPAVVCYVYKIRFLGKYIFHERSATSAFGPTHGTQIICKYTGFSRLLCIFLLLDRLFFLKQNYWLHIYLCCFAEMVSTFYHWTFLCGVAISLHDFLCLFDDV